MNYSIAFAPFAIHETHPFSRFGIVNPAWVILSWHYFWRKFQIWRPLTAVFYYPISPMTGFAYLINLYFLYSYSTRLETGKCVIPSDLVDRDSGGESRHGARVERDTETRCLSRLEPGVPIQPVSPNPPRLMVCKDS